MVNGAGTVTEPMDCPMSATSMRSGLRRIGKVGGVQIPGKPVASIVVPAHNEEAVIAANLRRLLAAAGPASSTSSWCRTAAATARPSWPGRWPGSG